MILAAGTRMAGKSFPVIDAVMVVMLSNGSQRSYRLYSSN